MSLSLAMDNGELDKGGGGGSGSGGGGGGGPSAAAAAAAAAEEDNWRQKRLATRALTVA